MTDSISVRAASLPLPPHLQGYWRHAPAAAAVLLSVVAIRLHEVMPLVGKLHPAMLALAFGLGLTLMNTSEAVLGSLFRNRIFQLALAYFIWASITAPYALWVGEAVDSLEKFIPALSLVVVLLLCQPSPDVLRRLQFWIVAAVTAMAVFAKLFGRISAGRLGGGGSLDPNDLAAVMAIFLPFAMSLARDPRISHKLLSVASCAALTTVIISTGSRGGVLALAVALVVYALGFRGSRMLAAAALIALGGTAAWQTAPAAFRDRITAIGQEQDYNYTAFGGRKQIWTRARMYIAERPITGVGIGNFGVREGQYCKEVLNRGCKWSTTHNAYLQAGAELGIPGMSIFIGLLLLLGWQSFPMWRGSGGQTRTAASLHSPELLASIAAFAAAAYFLSLAYFYSLFLLAGMVALAARVRVAELTYSRGLTDPLSLQVAVYSSGWRSAMGSHRLRTGQQASVVSGEVPTVP